MISFPAALLPQVRILIEQAEQYAREGGEVV